MRDIAIAGSVVLVLAVVVYAAVWLSRRSPARLSEEMPPARRRGVADRPAGPGAEPTGVARPGEPTPAEPRPGGATDDDRRRGHRHAGLNRPSRGR